MPDKHPVMREMLFVLGMVLHETDRQFSNQPLRLSISKADFISIVQQVGAVQKKERAVYRNLELLEEQQLIRYRRRDTNKNTLALTRKGHRRFLRLKKDYEQLSTIRENIARSNLLATDRHLQTVLRV